MKWIVLHLLFFLYSLVSVFSKLGSRTEAFSLLFFVYYGAVFLCLGLYAIGWQQILKKMSLSGAFSGKAVVILWGALLFGEAVTLRKIIGALVVMAGVILFSRAEEEKKA